MPSNTTFSIHFCHTLLFIYSHTSSLNPPLPPLSWSRSYFEFMYIAKYKFGCSSELHSWTFLNQLICRDDFPVIVLLPISLYFLHVSPIPFVFWCVYFLRIGPMAHVFTKYSRNNVFFCKILLYCYLYNFKYHCNFNAYNLFKNIFL